ncbi:MAG: hypothetical protein ABIE94_01045, partial [archaeon]
MNKKTTFNKIFRVVFIVVPLTIFGLSLFWILFDLINSTDNKLSFNVVQTIIVISVSLSILSFNYASALRKQNKKHEIAVYCGERFLQATIFSIIGWVLFYFGNLIIASWGTNINYQWYKTIIEILGQIIRYLGLPFIFWGIVEIDFSLKKLWKIA